MSITALLEPAPPVVDWAEAHRDNGRRLMSDAIALHAEGLIEGAEVLRHLSRLEYARAIALLLNEIGHTSPRTGP